MIYNGTARLVFTVLSLATVALPCARVYSAEQRGNLAQAQDQLFNAISKLNPDGVKAALDAGADADRRYLYDGFGAARPLELCCSSGPAESVLMSEAVRLLRERSRSRPDFEGVEARCLRIVEILLAAGAKVREGDDLLAGQIRLGQKRVVLTLIKAGENPNWQSDYTGLDSVSQAAVDGNDEMVAFLVEHGAKPPDREAIRPNIFIEAAHRGDMAKLQECLKDGVDVNAKNKKGETALVLAVGRSRTEVLEFLLEKGADPNVEGRSLLLSGTALHVAVYNASVFGRFGASAEWRESGLKIIKVLLAHGANVSSVHAEKGQTPLHIAAKYGSLDVAMILLDASAKVMARDADGNTPLDLAESGPMIKLLKEHGAAEH